MIILDTQPSPLWTDIVQAIGVGLGLPITIWGVIKLFIRDREREAEVKSLVDIAKSQNQVIIEMQNQLGEFRKQTQEMEYQSLMMKDSNELLKEQINLQTQAIMNDAAHKENLMKYEAAKRKSDNRPYFIFASGQGAGYSGEFSVTFKNVGKTAYFKRVVDQNENPIVYLPQVPREDTMIENGQDLRIGGSIKDRNKNINTNDYEFTFEFSDIDGVKYQQTLTRKNNGSSFIVSKPEEVI